MASKSETGDEGEQMIDITAEFSEAKDVLEFLRALREYGEVNEIEVVGSFDEEYEREGEV